MNGPISLREIERKAFLSTFDDGLWDILIGCGILVFALAPLLSESLGDFWSSVLFLPFWMLVYLAIRVLRARLVAPRVGQVRYGTYRQLRMRRLVVLMLIVNLFLLAAGIVVFLQANLRQWQPSLILSALMLFGFSLAAVLIGMPRLYLYALLLAAAPFVGEYLASAYNATHHGFPITFGFCAGFIILFGLLRFLQFLRSNPRLDDIQEA